MQFKIGQHRNGIGERVLGLPREPRSDLDVPFRARQDPGAKES